MQQRSNIKLHSSHKQSFNTNSECHHSITTYRTDPTKTQPVFETQLLLIQKARSPGLYLRPSSIQAEWLACWTQAQKGPGSNRSRDAVGNSLRQTVHTQCASVHQAAKVVAALLRVAGVTANLAESNGSLKTGL